MYNVVEDALLGILGVIIPLTSSREYRPVNNTVRISRAEYTPSSSNLTPPDAFQGASSRTDGILVVALALLLA